MPISTIKNNLNRVTKEIAGNREHFNVHAPTQIKCLACKKVLDPDKFSTVQLHKLKVAPLMRSLDVKKIPPSNIRCRLCTGGQVLELECFMCGDMKGSDEFARNQKRMGSKGLSICLECVRNMSEDAIVDAQGEEFVDEEEFDDDFESNIWKDKEWPQVPTVAASAATMTTGSRGISNYAAAGGIDSYYASDDEKRVAKSTDQSVRGGVSLPADSDPSVPRMPAGKAPRTYNAFDPDGNRHIHEIVSSVRTAAAVVPGTKPPSPGPAARTGAWPKRTKLGNAENRVIISGWAPEPDRSDSSGTRGHAQRLAMMPETNTEQKIGKRAEEQLVPHLEEDVYVPFSSDEEDNE